MKRFLTFSLLVLMCLYAGAQTVTTPFTGYDDHSHFVQLSQNNPNPFNGTTDVYLTVEEAGAVTLTISDINGRIVATSYYGVSTGVIQFRVTLSQTGTYVLTARQNGQSSSIKMICNEGGNGNRIEYVGMSSANNQLPQQEGACMSANGTGPETESFSQIDESEENDKNGEKKKPVIAENSEPFRVALSLSPFSLNQFEQGYSFNINGRTASTPEELQQIYRDLGSTEMYVRIATKRHVTAENTVDGVEDENANVHTFDQAIRLCQIAAELDIPINPEIMCAYTYMDMMNSQGPRFHEYPEIYALQNGKDWSELSLDEICAVLEAYGAFVAESILNTGCTVNNWNLGNEANFCFAGIGIGAKTAVNPKLAKASNLKRYLAPAFSIWWLKKHVWQYDAPAYAAVKRGVLSAYAKLGISDSTVKFSTHIATVVFPAKCSVKFFNYMKDNGYDMDVAGISYYPSAPSMSNRRKLLKKTVAKVNQKCDLPVFIGEFSYPSGKMEGPFAGWNKKLKGYKKDQQGQANLYSDVIAWGKENGMAGIRYWAPDYEGWYAMAMFEFSNKVGTAKTILQNHKELIEK
ncbi:MAG: glycosyl hydrolase 53 family protein [Bacteroidales bacterium]|nr:glycosyl hydrolase 53 family protein [Bacteroidales bacterium]